MFIGEKFSWAELILIKPENIEHSASRTIVRRFHYNSEMTTVEVWLCSDGRNELIREALEFLPFVRVFNVAGNNAYGSKRKRAVIMIAHGPICGAVDYSAKGDCSLKYPTFLTLESNSKINAGRQLEKFPKEYVAGVLYYNHETNTIEDVPEYDGAMVAWKEVVFKELKAALCGSLTAIELDMNKRGQNPVAIVVSDIAAPSIGRSIFLVNIQNGEFTEPVQDSIRYALDHSLKGEGSFSRTASLITAFRSNDKLPKGFVEFFENKNQFEKFISRGGNIYFLEVGDLPSEKVIYQLILK